MKKVLSILLIVVLMVSIFAVSPVYATGAADIIDDINPDMTDIDKDGNITGIAGKIIGAIRFASIIAAVILVAVFGFQFIMGSAEQKSDYQKKFIPLIVGVVVVFFGTTIASMIFSTLGV